MSPEQVRAVRILQGLWSVLKLEQSQRVCTLKVVFADNDLVVKALDVLENKGNYGAKVSPLTEAIALYSDKVLDNSGNWLDEPDIKKRFVNLSQTVGYSVNDLRMIELTLGLQGVINWDDLRSATNKVKKRSAVGVQEKFEQSEGLRWAEILKQRHFS